MIHEKIKSEKGNIKKKGSEKHVEIFYKYMAKK